MEGATLRILTDFGLGRAQGLNRAIQEAKGSIIARLDARTVIDPDYFRACLETMRVTGAANVGGVQQPLADTPTQKAIGIALQNRFGVGDAQFRLGGKSGPVDSVYLGFFRREIFDVVGGFDELAPVISEDSDMNQRIRDAGQTVWLNHRIQAYYFPRERIRDLWKLYFRYGGARAGNFVKRRTLAWRQLVAPVFILALLAGLLLAPFSSLVLRGWLGLIALYLAADLACSAWAAQRNARAVGAGFLVLFPRLTAIFPTMHFAWGLGFLRRLTQRVKPGQYWGY